MEAVGEKEKRRGWWERRDEERVRQAGEGGREGGREGRERRSGKCQRCVSWA